MVEVSVIQGTYPARIVQFTNAPETGEPRDLFKAAAEYLDKFPQQERELAAVSYNPTFENADGETGRSLLLVLDS